MGVPRLIQVYAKPGAKVSLLEGPDPDGIWHAQLRSLPVNGRANDELIALLAKHFGVRKSAISIKSGASGRIKRVRIDDV